MEGARAAAMALNARYNTVDNRRKALPTSMRDKAKALSARAFNAGIASRRPRRHHFKNEKFLAAPARARPGRSSIAKMEEKASTGSPFQKVHLFLAL